MNDDRGMKKFLPFSSLVEHEKCLNKMLIEKNKVKKPQLAIEQARKINNILLNINFDNEYRFKLYLDGYIYFVVSKIKDINFNAKKLYFEDLEISFSSILDIENDDPFNDIC